MSEKTFEFLYALDGGTKIKANSGLIDGISRSSDGIDGETIVVINTKILD